MLTNIPNLLTLSRIASIPLLVGVFYIGAPLGNWLGLGILIFAGATDFFDGYIARAMQQQSLLGKFLDPIADKLLVASLILMLVAFDRIPGIAVLPAVVILCRELLVSGLREFLAGAQVSLPVSRLAHFIVWFCWPYVWSIFDNGYWGCWVVDSSYADFSYWL